MSESSAYIDEAECAQQSPPQSKSKRGSRKDKSKKTDTSTPSNKPADGYLKEDEKRKRKKSEKREKKGQAKASINSRPLAGYTNSDDYNGYALIPNPVGAANSYGVAAYGGSVSAYSDNSPSDPDNSYLVTHKSNYMYAATAEGSPYSAYSASCAGGTIRYDTGVLSAFPFFV